MKQQFHFGQEIITLAVAFLHCDVVDAPVKLADVGGAVEGPRKEPVLNRGGGDIMERQIFITVYYSVYLGLLWILRTFNTEITVLLQRNLFTLKILSQIRPENPTVGENRPNLGPFYYGYYVFFFITEYYGKLRSVMFPPCAKSISYFILLFLSIYSNKQKYPTKIFFLIFCNNISCYKIFGFLTMSQ